MSHQRLSARKKTKRSKIDLRDMGGSTGVMAESSTAQFTDLPNFLCPEPGNPMFLPCRLPKRSKTIDRRKQAREKQSRHSHPQADTLKRNDFTYRPGLKSDSRVDQHHHSDPQIDNTDCVTVNSRILPPASEIDTTPTHGTKQTENGRKNKRKPRPQKACTECRDRKLRCNRKRPSCSSESLP